MAVIWGCAYFSGGFRTALSGVFRQDCLRVVKDGLSQMKSVLKVVCAGGVLVSERSDILRSVPGSVRAGLITGRCLRIVFLGDLQHVFVLT